MQWIENLFSYMSFWLSNWIPEGKFNDLVVNGVLAGLEGVLIFIPQIAFLFAFIVFLEDTGYMTRVSFMMDKFMRKIGLHGKSILSNIQLHIFKSSKNYYRYTTSRKVCSN